MISSYISPEKSTNFYSSIHDIIVTPKFIRKNRNLEYLNAPISFDIEATSFYNENREKHCVMYAFNFGINGRCVRGRTWREFIEMLDVVVNEYDINIKKRVIIYVQNLSYEFQWFRKYFEWDKVFAVDSREVLYAVTKNGIEFRCSYLLSGYSLEKMGEHLLKYRINKKVGDLDYKLLRHPETILTEKEWGYILNDGLVVMAYIQEEIERLGDITKIPLTKTGYVRNLFREKCLKGDERFKYVKLIKSLTLTKETYIQLKRAFAGGFTHANCNYVGETIKDVFSIDEISAYPAAMLSEKYPMSKPFKIKPKNKEHFTKILENFCCVFECGFYNIKSKIGFENYISKSKCNKIENFIINNGRVVEADYLHITITEQDFKIISKTYKWDKILISQITCFFKDYLPKPFVETILELYKNKTELKNVEGKEQEYMWSKEMVNSSYGMCVTDICKNENVYENGMWSTKNNDVECSIEKYNKNMQRFLFYAWGVWVTAYSRANLFEGILEFKDDYIYSDTDSIKCKNLEKHLPYINSYNERISNKIKKCLKHHNIDTELSCPKTAEGISKPLGIWENEGKYNRFKTLGSKRYIYEKNDDINITIAGVSKTQGKKWLKYKYKDNDTIFKNFKDELYFPSEYEYGSGCGKLCHTYIDTEMKGTLIDYNGIAYEYLEKSGVHMENTDYTLGLAEEFLLLLRGVRGGEWLV